MSYRALVLLVVVLAVASMAVRPSFDGDTWWHLRAGQWILDQRQVPTTDPFSHTMAGRPWVYPGWLAEVTMLGFYRLGGLAGLTGFTAVFVVIALAFLWRLLEGPLLLRSAVLLLAAAASAVHWAARPHIITLALASFSMWVLDRSLRGNRPRLLWLLPPAMALWANTHGGFAVGLILLLMAAGSEAFDLLVHRSRERSTWRSIWGARRARLTHLGLVLAASVAALAVNPHGPVILLYPFRTVAIPVLQAHILEWQPPDFRQPQLLPLLALLLVFAATLVVRRRRISIFEAVSAGGWAVLALVAVRNASIFALAAAPVVCRQVADALRPMLEREPMGAPSTPVRRRLHALAGGALIVATLGWASYQLGPESTQAHLRRLAPAGAVEFLREANASGNLFNDYNWGGYILWSLYPDHPTFVDGRTDVFSEQVFEDYLTFWSGAAGWPDVADRYSIGVVLLPPEAPVVRALELSGWAARYRDDRAVLLFRGETE